MDEHFRRSLGADYESLFKKKTSTGSGDSESSSPSSSTNSSINESTQSPKVPDQLVVSTNISHQTIQKQLNRSDTKTSPTESANCSSSNLQDNNKEDSTQVDDPVKAFQEDLEMEGYTGMSLFSSSIQLRIGGGDKSNSIELGGSPPVDLYWFFEISIWAFISN